MSSTPSSSGPSGAMLQAALGGLLSLAACNDPTSSGAGGAGGSGSTTKASTATSGATTTAGTTVGSTSGNTTSASSTSVGTTGVGSTSASTTTVSSTSVSSSDASASSSTGATNPHTPIPNTACNDGQVPNPMVTSSEMIALSHDDFLALCTQAGGIFEVQPLCGGSNACRGFAYDSATQILTNHTCQGTNTCAGYNCVVCS